MLESHRCVSVNQCKSNLSRVFFLTLLSALDTVQCLQLIVSNTTVLKTTVFKKNCLWKKMPFFAIITRNSIPIKFGIHLEEFNY